MLLRVEYELCEALDRIGRALGEVMTKTFDCGLVAALQVGW